MRRINQCRIENINQIRNFEYIPRSILIYGYCGDFHSIDRIKTHITVDLDRHLSLSPKSGEFSKTIIYFLGFAKKGQYLVLASKIKKSIVQKFKQIADFNFGQRCQ